MSNYYTKAIHPVTGRVEMALMMDDYFGRHRYGVRFGDDTEYRAEDVKLPEDRPSPDNGEKR